MSYYHSQIALNLAKRSSLPVFSQWAIQMAFVVMTWNDRYKGRHKLGTISHELLDDMGITPEQAFRESRKPIWKP